MGQAADPFARVRLSASCTFDITIRYACRDLHSLANAWPEFRLVWCPHDCDYRNRCRGFSRRAVCLSPFGRKRLAEWPRSCGSAVPAISSFDRQFIGSMANMAVAKLDDDQRNARWRVFQQSGVVTASTAFVDARMPTEGFEEAASDFSQCLGELDLVSR